MTPYATEAIAEEGSAIWFSQFGAPNAVVELRNGPPGHPGSDEVLVEVEFAPINPADLNVLEGKYGILPTLPAVPGIEGVGVVRKAGAQAGGGWVGKRVLLPHGFGSWRKFGVCHKANLVVVPEGVPVQQAAMLRINPATAWCMLREFVSLKPGEWIVQNAANSGVGRAVIQIAKACGWRTVNVVRREGLEAELASIGADAVVVEGEQLAKRIEAATGGALVRLGLNAVGGESALGLAKVLTEGGTLVTYGAMSLQPVRIPNGLLIFKDLDFRGFWVSRWYAQSTQQQRQSMFNQLFQWAESGVLHTPVEAVYPLGEIDTALSHAARGARAGKVLLAP